MGSLLPKPVAADHVENINSIQPHQVGGDSGLLSSYENRVSVHRMDDVFDRRSYSKATLLGALPEGQEWGDPIARFKVGLVTLKEQYA